jgi:hypothetical protein
VHIHQKRGCFFYFDVHNCIIMLDCFFINGVLHAKDNLVMTQPIYILLQNLSLFSFICCDFVNTFFMVFTTGGDGSAIGENRCTRRYWYSTHV